MNPFALLRIEIIKRPMFNILIVLLSVFWGNLGIAIILLTVIVRLLLVKNAMAATNMQKDMADFQPKMQEIQEKHKDDPSRMSSEMMGMFKKSGGGPFKGCLTMLIQIPVFLGLFRVVKDIALGNTPAEVYSFLSFLHVDLTAINTTFLGMDLLASKNVVLTILASVLMYFQMKMTTLMKGNQPTKIPGMDTKGMPDMSKMMGSMNIFFVVMMGGFVRGMPASIGLYIVTTTLFGVLQQAWQYRLLLKAKRLTRRGKPHIVEEGK